MNHWKEVATVGYEITINQSRWVSFPSWNFFLDTVSRFAYKHAFLRSFSYIIACVLIWHVALLYPRTSLITSLFLIASVFLFNLIQGVPHVSTTTEVLSGPNVEERRVYIEGEGPFEGADGEIVSTQTVSSKTRTVETITVSPLSLNERSE